MALLLSLGQDGPGSALAQAFGGFVTFTVWAISTAVIVWNPGNSRDHLEKGALTIVMLAILLLPALTILSAINHQDYDLRVFNETGTQVNDVTVRMIGRHYSFGVLSKGLFAVHANRQGRPKGIAEISWTGEDGQSHMAEVDLSDMIPRRYDNGVLTIAIQADDSAEVGFFINQGPSF